jgi:hypothetical protein
MLVTCLILHREQFTAGGSLFDNFVIMSIIVMLLIHFFIIAALIMFSFYSKVNAVANSNILAM